MCLAYTGNTNVNVANPKDSGSTRRNLLNSFLEDSQGIVEQLGSTPPTPGSFL